MEKGPVLSLSAPAKINLSLEVLGRESNGFHKIVSVMQTVSLCDVLEMSASKSLEFSSSDSRLESDCNLAVRAANLMREECRPEAGWRIDLQKNIPVAAGLGGGSSDAASTLIGVARLCGLSPSCEEFSAWAERLGSDVPFFLYGGPALVEGRGELVTSLAPPPSPRWYLLASPRVEVSTQRVFESLRPEDWTDGTVTRQLAASPGHGIGHNSLQSTLFRLYPESRTCFEEVVKLAPGRCIVSGSGPTVVALMDGEEEAREAGASLEPTGFWTEVVADQRMEGWQTPCAHR